MKSKTMIKNIGVGLVTLFLMMLSSIGYSQACPGNNVTITLQNFTQPASNQIEFDVFISNTGSTTLLLGGMQGAVIYNTGFLPATATGTLTAVVQPSATGNFPGFNVTGPAHTPASRQMRWSNTPVTLNSGNTIELPANTPLRFARFRFTSSLPFTQNFAGVLTPQFAVQGGYTNVLATVYCSGNPNSTGLGSATAGTLTLPSPYNVVLNPSLDVCFTSGAASDLTEVTCFGGNNGSATITMSPVPSSLSATYSVDGGASTPVTLTAGGAFNVSGLTVGSHSISVVNNSAGSCPTTPVIVPVTISGPTSQPTNSTSQTACDTYTWPVTGLTYTASGTYTGTSVNGNGCTVNEELILTINNSTSSTTTETACDTYTWAANGQTYTASGTYTNVTTNAAGCPDTATLVLTINNSTSSSTSITACDSYTWAANGQTYTASGTYTNVTTNAAGCPDTATLVLTINNSTSSTTTETACDSYTWAANGTTYTASGTYTNVTTNAAGCPDTATLVLTINNSTTTTDEATACDTYTWAANGQTYTASGTYTHVTTNAAGCPNTATLFLTINSSTSSSTSITACDTYTWAANGQTYTASGTYTNVTTNAAGCPDTATLVLTINNSTSSTTTETACDSYTWAANGTTYTASGTYTNVTTNAAGCPDTATLVLTINVAAPVTIVSSNGTTLDCNNPFTALEVVGAASTVWTQNGGFFGTANPIGVTNFTTGAITYGVTVTDANGCTTTSEIVINMTTPTTNTTTITACDSYTWANTGLTYTASGTYTGTTTDCVTEELVLTINNSTSSTTTETACDSYTWAANGQTYTASGTYTNVTTNAAGCPDTATLVLTINNSTSSSMSATACDTYTWAANGQTYTASGTYTNVTTNAAGCPDTATLVLTINNSTSSTMNVTSATPYTWAANGQTYTASGTYTFVGTNAAGCTFTQTLNLIIATGPTTEINPTQCGSTLPTINTKIVAGLVPGATSYRFRVTDLTTSNQQVYVSILRTFYLTNLPSYAFNTTYSVEVAVLIGGVWQAYGSPCNVTTPVVITQVQASQCGSTLTAMNQSILADNVPYAAGYRFRITDSSSTVTIADRPTRLVVLTAIAGFTPAAGATYSVEVAVKNTDGTYMPYGAACNITTPGAQTRGDVNTVSFNAVAYPNPFADSFMLDVKAATDQNIQVRVYDMLGKLVEDRNVDVDSINAIEVGSRFPSGVYNVIVSQGNEIKTLRVVKR